MYYHGTTKTDNQKLSYIPTCSDFNCSWKSRIWTLHREIFAILHYTVSRKLEGRGTKVGTVPSPRGGAPGGPGTIHRFAEK